MSKRRIRKKSRSILREWIRAIVFALVFFWLFTLMVFQIYPVSGTYMSGTFLPGDFILVNKIAYGPRFPVTPLSLPLVGDKLPLSGKNAYLDWIVLPGFRMPGYSKISQNDLVYFNYPGEKDKPVDRRICYVKRCIGLPGDTVHLKAKKVFVNYDEVKDPVLMQNACRVIAKPKSITRSLLRDLGISEGKLVSDAGVYRLYLTRSQADSLSKLGFVDQVRPELAEPGFGDPLVFPGIKSLPWNLDHYGPLIIPGKDLRINLNINNAAIYSDLIISEKNSFEFSGNKILINGLETDHYIFRNNYYFVMDDNRDNAKDSRYWGFLPENHIIGRTSLVVFSIDRSEEGSSAFRWKRFLKRLK